MIIRLGDTVKIESKTILCVLDMDAVTLKKRGQEIFNIQQQNIVYCDENELPLSCVIACENGETKLYLTPYSASYIQRLTEDLHFERKLK